MFMHLDKSGLGIRMTSAPVLMVCPHLPPAYQGGIEIHSGWLIESLSQILPSLIVIYLAAPCQHATSRETIRTRRHGNILYMEISIDHEYMSRPQTYFFNDSLYDTILSAIDIYRPRAILIQGGFRITSSAARAAEKRSIRYTVILHDFFYFCPKVNLLNNHGSQCVGNVSLDVCAKCLSAKSELSLDVMEDWMCDRRVEPMLPWLIDGYRSTAFDVLRCAHNLFAPSQYVGDKHSRRYPGVNPVTLRLGVPASYRRTISRIEHGSPQLAYIGHLHPHKGVHVLLEALELIAKSGLSPRTKIYGHLEPESYYHEQLRQRCMHLRDTSLEGEYEFSEMKMILSDVDVVIVPSIWQENSPLVIMIALRYGIPVIATNIGGIPEMLIDGWNGLLVDAGSAEQLAGAISRLLDTPEELSFLSSNATYRRTTTDEVRELISVL